MPGEKFNKEGSVPRHRLKLIKLVTGYYRGHLKTSSQINNVPYTTYNRKLFLREKYREIRELCMVCRWEIFPRENKIYDILFF